MNEIDMTRASKTAGKATGRTLYAFTLYPFVLAWRALKLVGRGTLWLVFWPLALVRSRNRKHRRETDRIVAEIRASRPLDTERDHV